MMRFIERSEDCVRVQCEDCGAHSSFEWSEYRMLVTSWRFAWCSTCGVLRLVGMDEDGARESGLSETDVSAVTN